jgi:hypothetical protein
LEKSKGDDILFNVGIGDESVHHEIDMGNGLQRVHDVVSGSDEEERTGGCLDLSSCFVYIAKGGDPGREPPGLAPGSRFFQKWIGGDESRCRAKIFSSAPG